MEPIILIILIGLAGGVAVGLQGPLASMISQRLGIFESVFIIHIGGALIALLPLLFYSGGSSPNGDNCPGTHSLPEHLDLLSSARSAL